MKFIIFLLSTLFSLSMYAFPGANCEEILSMLFENTGIDFNGVNHIYGELAAGRGGEGDGNKKLKDQLDNQKVSPYNIKWDDKIFNNTNPSEVWIFETILFYGIGLDGINQKYDKEVGRWVLNANNCFSVSFSSSLLEKDGSLPIQIRERMKRNRYYDGLTIEQGSKGLTFPYLETIEAAVPPAI